MALHDSKRGPTEANTTRLDLKLMAKRKGLGFEQLQKEHVGQLEKDLKNAMKLSKSKYEIVPGKLGRKHPL